MTVDPRDLPDPTERQMRRRVKQVRDLSVHAVANYVRRDLGMALDDVTVAAAHLVWMSPETDDEVISRTEHEHASHLRQCDWERKVWARLRDRAEAEGWQ